MPGVGHAFTLVLAFCIITSVKSTKEKEEEEEECGYFCEMFVGAALQLALHCVIFIAESLMASSSPIISAIGCLIAISLVVLFVACFFLALCQPVTNKDRERMFPNAVGAVGIELLLQSLSAPKSS